MTDWTLHAGDNRIALTTMPDNSIDSCVTDPPYHLTSIVKRFSGESTSNMHTQAAAQPPNRGAQYKRLSKGFMGKQWDGGDVAFQVDFWAEVLRVLKPGAFLVAFGATRGYHRMACAIEDAGFEIRDSLAWLYGTGFPKSHNVSKGIDNVLGIPGSKGAVTGSSGSVRNSMAGDFTGGEYHAYVPSSSTSAEWEGWGTALKPAFEPIVLARKPLSEPTVAANVLRWRTGALNIGACRVQGGGDVKPRGSSKLDTDMNEGWARPWMEDREEVQKRHDDAVERANSLGRWPANVVHDGSDEVVAAFPDTKSGQLLTTHNAKESKNGSMSGKNYAGRIKSDFGGDSGSAARFFYSAKAGKADRNGSKHPTVKPISLMAWLVRLVTPPGGVVLDPFAGSGTTGVAALQEGFRAVLCEREAKYIADINRRLGAPAKMPWESAQPAAFPWAAP